MRPPQAKPLDVYTNIACHRIMSEANRGGRDPVEELNRQGLILSPQVRLDLQQQLLSALVERLHDIRPAEMMRRAKRTGNTPTTMYETMVEFIQEYREKLEEK